MTMKKYCLLSLPAALCTALCAMLCAVSCIIEHTPGKKAGGQTDMSFTVTIPATSSTPASTRAAHTDTDIHSMDLFVFNGDTGAAPRRFVERVSTTDIEVIPGPAGDGSAECVFTVRLATSTTPRVIFFVANLTIPGSPDRMDQTQWPSGMQGTTYDEVMDAMRTTALLSPCSEDDMLPLVMWGRIDMPQITSQQNTHEDVKLLRAVAAIQVKTAAPTIENGLANFSVNAISARSATFGRVAPPGIWDEWKNGDPATQDPVDTFPPVPNINHFGSTTGAGYWSTGGDPHYVYESKGVDDTYVIVDANYNGARYFYKLQLRRPVTGVPLDLVRNHKYIINIIKVNGPGSATITDAANGPFANTIIETHVDEYDELVSFVSNSSDYMGMAMDNVAGGVYFIHESGTTVPVDVTRVYSSNGTYTASFTGSGFTFASPTFPVDPANAQLRILRGNISGAGTGTITVSNGAGLAMPISATVAITTGWEWNLQGGRDWKVDPNATVHPSDTTPWEIEILPGSMNVFMKDYPLSQRIQQVRQPNVTIIASGTNWGAWADGRTFLSSTTANSGIKIFFYVPNAGNYHGTIRYTCVENGQTVTRYYILED
jgi:hypothetical protein